MFDLLLTLSRNLRIVRFKRQLRAIDTGISPLTKKYGLDSKKRALDSRVRASLQLAYRYDLQWIRYYGTADWAVGIYEWRSENNNDKVGFMTVYMHLLHYSSPHLYFDQKSNNRLFRRDMPKGIRQSQLVEYDGYISSRFRLYVPPGYHLDSLVIGAPDVLDVIDRYNLGADIEILGNQLYFVFPNGLALHDKLDELVIAGHKLAAAIDDNLSRYHDDRAPAFNQPIGYPGRRLIQR